jgi:cytochrome c oxidase subunit IV
MEHVVKRNGLKAPVGNRTPVIESFVVVSSILFPNINTHNYVKSWFNIQILCFWKLSIVLFFILKHNVSVTGFCLLLQVKPTQLGHIYRAGSYIRTSNYLLKKLLFPGL